LALALPLIYGPAFAGAPSLVWVLLPGVFFWGVQMALVQFFVGTGLPKLIPAMWVATLALNVVLNLLLVPKFGARGAALVSTISYALIFGAVFIRFRQHPRRVTPGAGFKIISQVVSPQPSESRLTSSQ
jgi:O-antigen/teichoic acid export membrane protein